jgi:hypothetical protein
MSSEDLKGLAAREAGDVEALLEEGGTISARARDPHLEDVLEKVRMGLSVRGACGLTRFPRSKLYRWIDQDEQVKELVDQAIDEGFGNIEAKLMEGSSQTDDTDWRAVSWMLARRFPDEYGEKKELEIKAKGDNGIPEVIAMIEQTNDIMEDKDNEGEDS